MKRMIAPVVIVVILLAYLTFVVSLFFVTPELDEVIIPRIIAIVVVTLVAGALVAVLWQRYKELKKGEDDDLGEY